MNENLDLTKILKDCPKGWKFYTPICGEAEFKQMEPSSPYPIIVTTRGRKICFTKEGFYLTGCEGAECLLFSSKDQRDWSKFSAPWYKKDKFDPKTLKPFDKVLAREYLHGKWTCGFFSHTVIFNNNKNMYNMGEVLYKMCIPYNEETKHLVGTNKEAPEYYKYWED